MDSNGQRMQHTFSIEVFVEAMPASFGSAGCHPSTCSVQSFSSFLIAEIDARQALCSKN